MCRFQACISGRQRARSLRRSEATASRSPGAHTHVERYDWDHALLPRLPTARCASSGEGSWIERGPPQRLSRPSLPAWRRPPSAGEPRHRLQRQKCPVRHSDTSTRKGRAITRHALISFAARGGDRTAGAGPREAGEAAAAAAAQARARAQAPQVDGPSSLTRQRSTKRRWTRCQRWEPRAPARRSASALTRRRATGRHRAERAARLRVGADRCAPC